MARTYNEPSIVVNEGGTVHLDGPDGVQVSLTPAAALKTAGRLEAAALDALIEGVQEGKWSAPSASRAD